MPLWQGFIPQSGFIPLWYGITLFGLAAAILARLYLEKSPQQEEPVGKPLVVLAALAASIAGLGVIGFAPTVFLLLLVLFAAVERLPLVRSLLVATAVTTVLFLIFRTWLGVPLPAGLLGI
jgi:putative tricarboxylic transport membrane protein